MTFDEKKKVFEEYCKRFCPLVDTTRFNDEHTQTGYRFSRRDAKIYNFIVEHFKIKKDFNKNETIKNNRRQDRRAA